MAEQVASKDGKYIYAIADSATDQTYDFVGMGGRAVYALSNGRVAAVVSDICEARIRPERRYLGAHQAVLQRLMERSTILPAVFGIIANGPQGVGKLLSQNQAAFVEQLERVSGKGEMSLRVTWDVPNIFEYFVNAHRELRAAREALLANPQQEAKMAAGRMFEDLLNADRAVYTEKVDRVLSPLCFESKRNPLRNEHEVMNLAYLVGRDALVEFEAGVLEAARLFDDNFRFDYSGPWAPHHFVELALELSA